METLADLLSIQVVADFVIDHSWVWPLCEILHFTGMGLLIGCIGLLDVRILGLAKGLPIATLAKFVPYGVAGFVMNVTTGLVFVIGNPVGGPLEYLRNVSFQLKMLLIALAGINLLAYYLTGVARAAESMPPDGEASRSAKVIAAASLAFWFGVIFFGRMIMYNDTLLYAFGL